MVDVDLDRVRQLRASKEDATSALPNAAKAGVLTQRQRPELWPPTHPGTEHVSSGG